MIYFKSKFEDILKQEITYTTDVIGSYYMYNYSLKNNKYLICTLKVSEKICHIELIIFPDEFKKQGFGTKMVNAIKEWCYQNDYHIIELYAIHNSRQFWEKQGFEFIKENNNKMKFIVNNPYQ